VSISVPLRLFIYVEMVFIPLLSIPVIFFISLLWFWFRNSINSSIYIYLAALIYKSSMSIVGFWQRLFTKGPSQSVITKGGGILHGLSFL